MTDNIPRLGDSDNTLLVKILRSLAATSGASPAYVDAGDTADRAYADATFVKKAGDLMTGSLGIFNAVAPPLSPIRLNVGATAQSNVVRINGDSTANNAPVLDLFRSGNREFFLTVVGNSLFIGNSAGLADFNDATLTATPAIEITSLGALKINRGVITANDPSLNITSEWNNGATSFVGMQMTLTDIASLAASKFLDFTNVTSRFSVRKDGRTVVGGDLLVSGAASPALAAVKVNVGVTGAQNAVCVNGDSAANHAPVLHLLRSGSREVAISIVGTSLYFLNSAGLANYDDATLSAATTLEMTSTGGFKMNAPGAAISIASGANQRAGNATLVAGTVTVSNTTVTANTIVMLTRKTSGGTIGTAITYTVSAGTSFTVTSDSVLDTSTFSYLLIEVP